MRLNTNTKKWAEVSINIINKYFNTLTAELKGIPSNNIWNYDETNLMDKPGRQKIVMEQGSNYQERITNLTLKLPSL